MEEFLVKIVLTVFLSAIIGLEREIRHKTAGIRTHILVGLASFSFTFFSLKYFSVSDATRIIANILVGMGFIGAGTIIKENHSRVVGVTTAASLWFTTSIGILVGLDFIFEAFILTLVCFFVLSLREIYLLFFKNIKW